MKTIVKEACSIVRKIQSIVAGNMNGAVRAAMGIEVQAYQGSCFFIVMIYIKIKLVMKIIQDIYHIIVKTRTPLSGAVEKQSRVSLSALPSYMNSALCQLPTGTFPSI